MFKVLLKIIAVIFLMATEITSVFASNVNGVRFWQDPEKTRLVFDVSESVKYKLFTLDKPYRLVVDIEKAQLKADISKIEIPTQLVKKIRSSHVGNKLRIVLDLKNGVSTKDFTLKPFQNYGHRLVVDLRDKNAKKQVIKTVASTIQGKNRNIIIAIDAGHGGEDPGALGAKGTREKNITLNVAKKLAKLVNAEKGFKAFLTRKSDYYVGLEKRTQLARQNKADLFISLHADGFKDPKVKGASVWVLSPKGANSEMGKWLEKREKSSDLLGGVESLSNKDPLVAQVLLDLSMHHSVGVSINAAERVRKELSKKMKKMHGKSLKKAAFVVLKMPDIPAMLVEMAFISNPQEEKRLKTRKQQQKVAQSVFAGVKSYFKSYPPDGSYYAAMMKQGSHSVVRSKATAKNHSYQVKNGDTLSQIAQSFGISTKKLKTHNRLKSTRLKIGQMLTIPGA